MNIDIITIGEKMPDWVTQGAKDYIKRLPSQFRINFIEIPLIKRAKNQEVKARRVESEQMLAKLSPKAYIVALDVKGQLLESTALAKRLTEVNQNYPQLQILIGGPEGLSEDCLKRCHQRWSLSKLTFPHPLVRIILAEALYRSHTINSNHPYHK